MSKRKKRIGRNTRSKKARGRPPVNEWPEQIPDTPENVAWAILTTPPKKDDEWEYMKRQKKK